MHPFGLQHMAAHLSTSALLGLRIILLFSVFIFLEIAQLSQQYIRAYKRANGPPHYIAEGVRI